LEIEHARHVYARFVKNNMEMKMALEQEQDEDKKGHARVRSKRNIFGSIISSLTGLATGARPRISTRRIQSKLIYINKTTVAMGSCADGGTRGFS
jgi:hypothetical protein